MSVQALTRVVVEKQLALLKRYWVNTASSLLTTYVMFLAVFLGGQAVAPVRIDNAIPGVIVGFFLWSMSWSAFQHPAGTITEEAQWGTLEQLYVSPFGLRRVLLIDLVVNLSISLGISLALLGLMMVTTGRYLVIDLLTVIPILALSMASVAGLGFAMGGLALLYKRIGQTFLLLQFLFLGAIAAPSTPSVLQLLPLALGNDLLRLAMEDGLGLFELPTIDLLILVAKAVLFIAIGGFCFEAAIRRAKNRGLMGDY